MRSWKTLVNRSTLFFGGVSKFVVAVGLTGISVPAVLPALAQSPGTPSQERIQLPPTVLAEIREAPFSQLFSVANGKGYGVKDKDYTPAQPDIGVFTLWGAVPASERTMLAVKYCLPNTDIARAGASLAQVDLMDGTTVLASIDQVIDASRTNL